MTRRLRHDPYGGSVGTLRVTLGYALPEWGEAGGLRRFGIPNPKHPEDDDFAVEVRKIEDFRLLRGGPLDDLNGYEITFRWDGDGIGLIRLESLVTEAAKAAWKKTERREKRAAAR